MLFDRLLGQETEYAIRFSPERRHPGNDVIYDALSTAIGSRVKSEPGLYAERPQIFIENGGAFHYEYLPYCAEGGLIEGATPECRGPAQLLLYQKAQEALLLDSLSEAEGILRASGFPGKLGLLKNCRDAEGHVYGAQESFQVALSTGPRLFVYRFALAALFPLLALTVVAGWAVFLLLMFGMLACRGRVDAGRGASPLPSPRVLREAPLPGGPEPGERARAIPLLLELRGYVALHRVVLRFAFALRVSSHSPSRHRVSRVPTDPVGRGHRR